MSEKGKFFLKKIPAFDLRTVASVIGLTAVEQVSLNQNESLYYATAWLLPRANNYWRPR